MARARLLKPGFFHNDRLCELPMSARLLFAGLWTIADREGRLEDRPKRIKAEIFPYDPVRIDDLLRLLDESGFIHRYVVDQIQCIEIPSFLKHQSPHVREPASSIPAPVQHSASTSPAPDEHEASPSSRARASHSGNPIPVIDPETVTVEDAADAAPPAPKETPVKLPPKTVVTEEWLREEREAFGSRLTVAEFDEAVAFRMGRNYFKGCNDKRAYVHSGLEQAAERAAERKGGRANGSARKLDEWGQPVQYIDELLGLNT